MYQDYTVNEESPSSKVCTKCGADKPLTEYHKHPLGKDGLHPQCKACRRAINQPYRKTDKVREAQKASRRKWYWEGNGKQWSENYRTTDSGKESIRRAGKKQRIKYPEKSKARIAVRDAVAKGVIPRVSTLVCAQCGHPAQEYHHPDYNKPLDVVPLCRKCHTKERIASNQK